MSDVSIGTPIPTVSTRVDSGRMKVFSLLTDDPNPIHWDVTAVAALGLGDRLINQGGLNVAYVVNAVAEWAGSPAKIRELKVRFLGNVFEGDEVRAGGTVVATEGNLVTLDVWLERSDGTACLRGTVVTEAPDG